MTVPNISDTPAGSRPTNLPLAVSTKYWSSHPEYFSDFRVLPHVIAALGDNYGELADLIGEILLKQGNWIIPLLKERNIPIISMSGNPASLLAKYSACHLNVAVEREACPLNLAPTSSTTATLAMGDAIACALMTVRKFQAKDFEVAFGPQGQMDAITFSGTALDAEFANGYTPFSVSLQSM